MESFKINGSVDELISLHPLVNSILPSKVPYKEEEGMFRNSSRFLKTMLI